jgi:hypothetical protein
LLASLAGFVLVGRIGAAESIGGTGFELQAIGAAVIGGASLFGGEGNPLGSLRTNYRRDRDALLFRPGFKGRTDQASAQPTRGESVTIEASFYGAAHEFEGTGVPAQVVVLGSLHLDIVVHASDRPRKGETPPGNAWGYRAGGKGGNQAVAAAQFGVRTSMGQGRQ